MQSILSALGFWLVLNISTQLIAIVRADNKDFECGKRYPKPTRIVGGKEAPEGDFPWQVSVMEGKAHFCGGSIIDPEWILTASHCLEGKEKSKLQISAGNVKWAQGTKHEVIKQIKHEKFSLDTFDSDIALLKIKPALTYSKGNNGKGAIGPICLPEKGQTFSGKATVAGWGATKTDGKGTQKLRMVDANILDNKKCSTYDIFKASVMICAGYAEGGKDSCQGDSGGPLLATKNKIVYQMGVVSFGGDDCAEAGSPGVYAKVSALVDWINKKMKEG